MDVSLPCLGRKIHLFLAHFSWIHKLWNLLAYIAQSAPLCLSLYKEAEYLMKELSLWESHLIKLGRR